MRDAPSAVENAKSFARRQGVAQDMSSSSVTSSRPPTPQPSERSIAFHRVRWAFLYLPWPVLLAIVWYALTLGGNGVAQRVVATAVVAGLGFLACGAASCALASRISGSRRRRSSELATCAYCSYGVGSVRGAPVPSRCPECGAPDWSRPDAPPPQGPLSMLAFLMHAIAGLLLIVAGLASITCLPGLLRSMNA